jgi:hypothetical protein
MWARATVCYREIDGKWMITHEHESVPFDVNSGKASLDLEVRIVGHRLDAPGALRWQRQPDSVTNVLVITDPGRTSVIPSGASSAVMRAYSFIPTYVFYPSPGCWEFTIRIGEEEVQIVREMKGRR